MSEEDHVPEHLSDEESVPEPENSSEGGSTLPPDMIKQLLFAGTAAAESGTEEKNREGLERIEKLIAESMRIGEEQQKQSVEANRSMRAYFTDEIGRLRTEITGELRVRAALRLLQDMVPVLNDFDDLLDRTKGESHDESTARMWRALEAFRRRLFNGMRRIGLKEIDIVENETLFDPHIHECIDTIDHNSSSDGGALPPDTIVQVKRRGYLFQDELFQAPLVIIQGE